MGNPSSENRCQAIVIFALGIQRWQPMCIHYRKFDVWKLTSGLCVFFIRNRTSENQCWKTVTLACFFHSKSNIRNVSLGIHALFHRKVSFRNPMSGQHIFSLVIWCQKTNFKPMCFLLLGIQLLVNIFFSLEIWHLKTDVWPTCFFSSEIWHRKIDVRQHVFFIENLASAN